MKKFLRTEYEHSKMMPKQRAYIWYGMIAVLSVVLGLQLIAAQWGSARHASVRRVSSAYRPISGRFERRPPLLFVALSADELHLSEAQKNRLRQALPQPPKSLRPEMTPSLIASFQSLQAAEWTVICDVLTPEQLKIFLHRLASMRVFRMLQMKLRALLFSSTISTTPDARRIGDAPAAIPMMNTLVMLAFCVCLPQGCSGVSGKIRLQHLRVLRL